MSFYPCRGGGGNLNNVEEKSFTGTPSSWITNVTLDKNYTFAYIVTANNILDGDGTYVYVSLNGVQQKGTFIQGSGSGLLSVKAVTLRNLKKGDVVTVRGLGLGTFIK
nr:MAG TPA: collagen X [Ackermannviridae sp.]